MDGFMNFIEPVSSSVQSSFNDLKSKAPLVVSQLAKEFIDPLLPKGHTVESFLASLVEDEATKLAKEAFVTGYNGSSKHDIFMVLIVIASAILTSSSLSFLSSHLRNRASTIQYSILRFLLTTVGFTVSLLGFFLAPLSFLASIVFSSFNGHIATGLVWISFCAFTLASLIALPIGDPLPQKNVAAVTRLRGALLILTAISVLAVDFHVFPRAFVKTETFGVSLMDIGVGGFMFVNAITSNLARATSKSVSSSAKRTVQSLLPLLFIGFMRTLAHLGINYQHHVSEYGVHWNYFYTLAGVLLATDLVLALFQKTVLTSKSDAVNSQRLSLYSATLGLLVLALHQYNLSENGLTEFVFSSPRVDIISANKEGIVSVLGYLALTLISVPIGRMIVTYSTLMSKGAATKPATRIRQAINNTIILALVSVASYCFVLSLEDHVQMTSRRLCNAPFVFWIFSIATGLLAASFIPDICTEFLNSIYNQPSTAVTSSSKDADKKKTGDDKKKTEDSKPVVQYENNFVGSAFTLCNSRPLSFFMISNLMTGAVNLFTDTMATADEDAVIILAGYIMVAATIPKILNFCASKKKSQK